MLNHVKNVARVAREVALTRKSEVIEFTNKKIRLSTTDASDGPLFQIEVIDKEDGHRIARTAFYTNEFVGTSKGIRKVEEFLLKRLPEKANSPTH